MSEWCGFWCNCVLIGPWDFYQDGPGENASPPPATYGLPIFARTASINLDEVSAGVPSDYDSNDEWFVSIPNEGEWKNFQHKITQSSITTLGIPDSEYAYFYLEDSGVNNHFSKRTFRFTTDNDGFEDAEDNLSIDAEWDGESAFQFNFDGVVDGGVQQERAVLTESSPGVPLTWEGLNVPEGATVVAAELFSFRRRVLAISEELTDEHSITIRIKAADDTIIIDDNLYSDAQPLTTSGGFSTVFGGGSKFLNETGVLSYSASNTPIKIEIQYDLTLDGEASDPNTILLDDIRFDITHTGIGIHGNAMIDAESQELRWIVSEFEWADLEYR
jgi:hypothetical protein